MASFTSPMVCPVYVKRPIGPTCGALAIVLGPMAENGSLHDFWASTKSKIAREALDRIGKFYDIERDINGQPADIRHAARQKLSQPKVATFFTWSEQQLLRIPGKNDFAKTFRIRYGLNRQEAFSLFRTDGRVAIDKNPAERALRPIGIGRKNWLCAGADTGAETLARAMTIIETAKLNELNP
jgi:transposase